MQASLKPTLCVYPQGFGRVSMLLQCFACFRVSSYAVFRTGTQLRGCWLAMDETMDETCNFQQKRHSWRPFATISHSLAAWNFTTWTMRFNHWSVFKLKQHVRRTTIVTCVAFDPTTKQSGKKLHRHNEGTLYTIAPVMEGAFQVLYLQSEEML